MGAKRAPAIERFERHYIPEPNTGCWLWFGAQTCGYGSFRIDGKAHLAHRFSYQSFVGEIPEGLELDHLCRVRCCVNPEHLEPVTRMENLRRSPIFDGNKTHCPHGHAYNEENTIWFDGNCRMCRTCRNIRNFNYRQAKRNARTDFACTG